MTRNANAEELFSRHQRDIHRYLSRMTGSRDTADDLSQEVFLRVVRGLNGSAVIAHERGWVFSIAHSVVTDHHRERQRTVRTVNTAGRALPSIEPSQHGVQALALALGQSLQSLPETDRGIFLLKEVAGMSYEEIAHTTGCTVDAVRARLYRARSALRESLSIRF